MFTFAFAQSTKFEFEWQKPETFNCLKQAEVGEAAGESRMEEAFEYEFEGGTTGRTQWAKNHGNGAFGRSTKAKVQSTFDSQYGGGEVDCGVPIMRILGIQEISEPEARVPQEAQR